MKKNIIVFGGSGFIGSHLADILSDKHNVTIFDIKKSKWLKKNQKMIIGSILDKSKVDEALKNMDFVYHFAGIADIDESTKKRDLTINLNIIGTTNILESIIKSKKVKKFIFASTLYVYSDYGSIYRATKQSCETIIETYSSIFSLDYIFLRYGSLYGSRSQEWNGINKRIREIQKNKKIVFNGNGEEVREYINVKDAAEVSSKMILKTYKKGAYTITGPEKIKSIDLLRMIFDIFGYKKNIIFTSRKLKPEDRYLITPYKFTPKLSKKITPKQYIDIGEGLLEIISNEYSKRIKS